MAMAQPQGAAPQAAPQQAPGAQQAPQSPMAQLIISTDKSLLQVAQAIGQINQGAGQAFGQLEQQFRSLVTKFLQQAQSGGAQPQGPSRSVPQQAPAQAGAAPQQQAM